jgi:hypothetical protein
VIKGGSSLMDDLTTRVNIAHTVLSSSLRRALSDLLYCQDDNIVQPAEIIAITLSGDDQVRM